VPDEPAPVSGRGPGCAPNSEWESRSLLASRRFLSRLL